MLCVKLQQFLTVHLQCSHVFMQCGILSILLWLDCALTVICHGWIVSWLGFAMTGSCNMMHLPGWMQCHHGWTANSPRCINCEHTNLKQQSVETTPGKSRPHTSHWQALMGWQTIWVCHWLSVFQAFLYLLGDIRSVSMLRLHGTGLWYGKMGFHQIWSQRRGKFQKHCISGYC